MRNLVYKVIDGYEETFEGIYEKIYKPLKDTSIKVLKDNECIKPLVTLINSLTINKINQFMNNIEEENNIDIKDFISSLNPNELIIFSEMTNKVIDFDDQIQIYIMSILMKSLKENEDFNYQEKSLYYNLKQLTEDDFTIYYCFLKKHIIEDKYNSERLKKKKIEQISFSINSRLKNRQLIEIVLKKFTTFNIVIDKSYVMTSKEDIDLQYGNKNSDISIRFGLVDYSITFYKILEEYFSDKGNICNKVLEEKEGYGKISTIDWIV